jgi:hypothetical protein
MQMDQPSAPRWAGRVSKHKIRRLYEDDACGMHDKALINEVAYTLLARCKSMLLVEAARNGRATCPVCEAIIEHQAKKGALLACEHCSWTGLWDLYRRSMDGLHLIAPGLQPFCREYVRCLPQAKTSKLKMYWIDWLIHRCHWEGTAMPGQPGAVCLIQGRAQDVNAFLASLTAGTHRPENFGDLGPYWSEAQKEQINRWRKAADRRRRK